MQYSPAGACILASITHSSAVLWEGRREGRGGEDERGEAGGEGKKMEYNFFLFFFTHYLCLLEHDDLTHKDHIKGQVIIP